MTVSLSPVGGAASQFFNSGGVPLYGGKIYSYEAGTTTPKATYTEANGLTAHPNPIILDSAGRVPGGEIWLTSAQAYLFILKTSSEELIGTYDNLYGIAAGAENAVTEVQIATAGQTSFVLTSMTYTPGVFTLGVYIDSVNQVVNNSYVETSATTVTFVSGLHVGAVVKFININSAATSSNLVTYLPGGASATTTSVQAKLREGISVLDFGADPTGVADSTSAFTAARAVTNRYFIPSGIYKLDASPDPFLDCYTSGGGVTLVVGGVSYACSNAFAGPLRYQAASATKTNIVHSKSGNIVYFVQDGSPGTATTFNWTVKVVSDSHYLMAQPSTNGGSTDMLWQRSVANADSAGNRFNQAFEEATDRMLYSYATTASGAPSFDSYMRVWSGSSAKMDFPALAPTFRQGWSMQDRAETGYKLSFVVGTDRHHIKDFAGTFTHMTFKSDGSVGFFGAGGVTRPNITGSRGANAALASLLTSLAQLGLVTDSTTV